ncbi:MAG: hypothetical protein AB7P49_19230, partial [Bdellovibrionales bacterium]
MGTGESGFPVECAWALTISGTTRQSANGMAKRNIDNGSSFLSGLALGLFHLFHPDDDFIVWKLLF